MLRLEGFRKDVVVNGLDLSMPVRAVTAEPAGEITITVYFKMPGMKLSEPRKKPYFPTE